MDMSIICPINMKKIEIIFTDPKNWDYYCKVGYSFLFEEEKEVKKQKRNKNDIS